MGCKEVNSFSLALYQQLCNNSEFAVVTSLIAASSIELAAIVQLLCFVMVDAIVYLYISHRQEHLIQCGIIRH